MIYAGLIHFDNTSDREEILVNTLQSCTESTPLILRKKSLILCYGKASSTQDLDDIWENESSVLVGRIFHKERPAAFEKEAFKHLSHLNNQQTLKDIWGKYVYLQSNKEDSYVEVVVDPTGQLPFFYYCFPDGTVLFASDIEIIYKVLGQQPEYDWAYLCSYLMYGTSSAIQTPFKNISELPPSCQLHVNKTERKTTPFWNPLQSYQNADLQAKSAVEILQNTMKPWIEPYENIYVSLSGGLDSSSLVYCLKDIVRKDQSLKAINYYHSQVKSSNELPHARQVCEETGVELIEIDASIALPFDSSEATHSIKPNKPCPGMISARWMDMIKEYLPSNSSSTFISGHGSDHIFMRPPSKKSISDFVLEQGMGSVSKSVSEIAQFYRDPLWSLVKENTQSLSSYFLSKRTPKRGNTVDESPSWIKQEVRQKALYEFAHPIYESLPQKILPGKYDQIDACYEGICSIQMELMNHADPTYYPFLYQPVMEFALAFPTYKLFEKGYDRYPLRQSVSEKFHTNTVWRRDKSQTTGIFQLGVKQNLDHVLDLCLEGRLAKEGFLDKEALHQTITLISHGDTKFLWPFIHVASIETFLRHWQEKN